MIKHVTSAKKQAKIISMFVSSVLAPVSILMLSLQANAAVIYFEEISQTGNRYEYNYSVFNDSSSDVDWFTIFFDFDNYENLEITNSPTDWDPLVIQPDPFFGNGYADWFAFGAPIAVGEMLSGFRLAFDWIGEASEPFSSQYYEMYDSSGGGLLEFGSTRRVSETVAVPEPASFVLFGIGLIGLGLSRKKKSLN